MEMVSKESLNGKTIITTKTTFMFFSKTRKFEAQKESPKGYWKWLELPKYSLVPSHLSFQLDEWNKI